jgi:hypothetical protein
MQRLLTFLFLMSCLMPWPSPAKAYEKDTHFGLTYFLARSAGLPRDAAMKIAVGDWSVDRAKAAAKSETAEAVKGALGAGTSKVVAAYMTFSGPDYGSDRVLKKSQCDNPAAFYQFEGADSSVFDAMAMQFVQDALEVVFARAIKAGAAGLPTSVKAALEKGGLTRWSAIVSGGRAFIGAFPRQHVLDAIKPGRGASSPWPRT